VILGEGASRFSRSELGRLPTIDELFRSAVARTSDAVALIDRSNRDNFTDGTPRRLTYVDADRIVSATARQLSDFSLPADTVVAVQLPNVVESMLVLLGILRAGLIAAPPSFWKSGPADAG
jgi:acyl-CoA synthetase (AMP-forming)/AMP-acid ligase II